MNKRFGLTKSFLLWHMSYEEMGSWHKKPREERLKELEVPNLFYEFVEDVNRTKDLSEEEFQRLMMFLKMGGSE
jgi:hypothetical protein